jgi:hypothetical protein
MYGHETHQKPEIAMMAKFENRTCASQTATRRPPKQGDVMDQYKKTFIGMQVVIFLVTAGMFLLLQHNWVLCVKFFFTMQVASVIGAVWGQRLKGRVRASGTSTKGGI